MAKNKKRSKGIMDKKFPLRMQKKLVILFITIILAFIVLISRIIYINAFDGEKYTKKVLEQQQYGSRIIPYKRGDILDRNGTRIAYSERVYNVVLDVKFMLESKDSTEPTIKVLKDFFEIDEESVREVISKFPESQYQILKKGVSYEVAQKFKEVEKDRETYGDVKGVWLELDYKRTYPYGTIASDVIGFTQGGNFGSIGIESSYNEILNGTDGREYGYFGPDSKVKRTIKEAENGKTVVSTIDVTLQNIVMKHILDFNEEQKGAYRKNDLGSANTAVMIMNPNNGEILAEASYPNFDLNDPRNIEDIFGEEYINSLSEEEKVDKMNALWRNFCVSDAYEPGSTFKPFTVAAGLETGAIDGSEQYYCEGSLQVEDYNIRCHIYPNAHGTQSVEDSIKNSCNVGLMHIAEAIGVEDFLRYQHIFGFGEYTGIDLPGEGYTGSLLHNDETMHSVELATCSFGQGFNSTMTQLMTGFCSIINGGNYYKPHVVKQIEDSNGNIIETKDPVLVKKTISAETAETVKGYMRTVVNEGTGKNVAIEGYDIGGKTGTAEKVPRNQGNYLLSFIGFVPVDNPEIAIYTVIDEPNAEAQANSSYVTELTRRILEDALPYLDITRVDE